MPARSFDWRRRQSLLRVRTDDELHPPRLQLRPHLAEPADVLHPDQQHVAADPAGDTDLIERGNIAWVTGLSTAIGTQASRQGSRRRVTDSSPRMGCIVRRCSRGMRRPPMRMGRTSANIGDALAQPLSRRTLWFKLLPLAVAVHLGRYFVALFTLQTRPLRVQPRGASRHPFLCVHLGTCTG